MISFISTPLIAELFFLASIQRSMHCRTGMFFSDTVMVPLESGSPLCSLQVPTEYTDGKLFLLRTLLLILENLSVIRHYPYRNKSNFFRDFQQSK